VADDEELLEPERGSGRVERRNDGRNDAQSAEEDASDVGEVMADESMQAGESMQWQLVKKLVRYALACEYSRTPIRRDGIRDKGAIF
jgi:hypothetical protein